jgi:hypothetical protein
MGPFFSFNNGEVETCCGMVWWGGCGVSFVGFDNLASFCKGSSTILLGCDVLEVCRIVL